MTTYRKALRALCADEAAEHIDRHPWRYGRPIDDLRAGLTAHKLRRSDVLDPEASRADLESELPAPQDAPTDLVSLMTTTASARRATAELQSIRRADRMRAKCRYPLTDTELMGRLANATAVMTWATPDEREEAFSAILLSVLGTVGAAPMNDDAHVNRYRLQTRIRGFILNDRDRRKRHADQHDDVFSEGDEGARTAEEKIDALALKAGGSVWAVASSTIGLDLASTVAAEELSGRLCKVTRVPLHEDERNAIAAALAGYGYTGDRDSDHAELAARTGVSPQTAHKRLQRGRERLLKRAPTPTALRRLLAKAWRLDCDADDPRLRLGPDDRDASDAIDTARHALYRTARTSGNYGRRTMAGRTLTYASVRTDNAGARRQAAARAAWCTWTREGTKRGWTARQTIARATLAATAATKTA